MKNPVSHLIDHHCHILPYVDDGAEDLYEAKAMLHQQEENGVTHLIATPHYHKKLFETPDEEIIQQFERLCSIVKEEQIPIKLILGREYYCNDAFFSRLEQNKVIAIGRRKALLIEFHPKAPAQRITDAVGRITDAGYTPVLAHVERYDCIVENPALLDVCREKGALVQVNAGSFIGQDGRSTKKFCKQLMKYNRVDLLGSDAHHMDEREPNLLKCANYLERKWGISAVKKLLESDPLQVITHE